MLLQALLAAVEAGPGSSAQPSQEDAAKAAKWRETCGAVVEGLHALIDLAGANASRVLQQLGQLGVWQQLEQLVQATGALRPAMCLLLLACAGCLMVPVHGLCRLHEAALCEAGTSQLGLESTS